jgi:broad specificity phosphatase PhoE
MRAKQTAELINYHHQLTVTTNKALRERTLGEFDGKPIDFYESKLKKLLERFNLLSDEDKLKFEFPHGMESYGSVATRVLNFLREVAVGYPGKTILMVSHGGVVRHTLVKLGGATYKQLPSYSVDNLGYFKLESDGVDFWVKETSGINFQNE